MRTDHVTEIVWLLRRGLAQRAALTELKYYFLLRAWNHHGPRARAFVDVHDTAGIRKPADLRRELAKRMRQSDVLLLILSERTASSRGLVSWEIDTAADHWRLPIICTYTGSGHVDSAETVKSAWWPDALRRIIAGGRATTAHVAFRPLAIAQAVRGITRSPEGRARPARPAREPRETALRHD